LKTMQVGDRAFFYHSNIGKAVVGVVTVSQTAFPDPTEPEGTRWVAVKVQPVAALVTPVTLAQIKAEPTLALMEMLRQSRLSVAQVRNAEWAQILAMGGGLAT
jgi:predicted RNA-binding protein with PUA-like domain